MYFIGRLKGRWGKVAYGFGNLGQALIFHTIGTFLIYFYVEKVMLDPTLVGLGFLISYGIWNSINDPIAGYISDRTRTRWGRRIPYIMFCTPPMILFFTLIWFPPIRGAPLPTPHNLWIFLYFVVVVAIFEFLYTFVVVGWNSLFPEMYETLEERTEVSVYRQIGAMIGVMVGFLLVPFFIASLTESLGTFSGWMLTGVIVAFISGGSFLISLLGSRERKEFSMAGTLPIKDAFKVTLTNKSFLTAAISILMISWLWSFILAMAPFAVDYMFGGTIADVPLISAPFIFVAFLFYPLWRKICIRLGTKKTLIIATSLGAIFLLPLFLVADTVSEAVLIMGFYGFANSGILITRELLVPDVIDEDELKTGFRREGVYLGVTTFIDRFALALTGGATALIFGLIGFIPGVANPSSVVWGMRFGAASIVMIVLVVFLISMKYYPLNTEKVIEVRKKLDKLRREKSAS